jgi:hypothetical protein
MKTTGPTPKDAGSVPKATRSEMFTPAIHNTLGPLLRRADGGLTATRDLTSSAAITFLLERGAALHVSPQLAVAARTNENLNSGKGLDGHRRSCRLTRSCRELSSIRGYAQA